MKTIAEIDARLARAAANVAALRADARDLTERFQNIERRSVEMGRALLAAHDKLFRAELSAFGGAA